MPMLSFQKVQSTPRPVYDTGLDDVTFALGPGDLILIRTSPMQRRTPLFDLAQGLLPPDAGEVECFGRKWASLAPDALAQNRARIGRTFDTGSWLSNLDLDENVTLAQRYHTQRAEAEIESEAVALAHEFDLPDLPRGRPHLAPRQVRRRAQWIRALLGKPDLLLLDQPSRDLLSQWTARLVQKVSERRAAGVAAIWITAEQDDWTNPELKPTLKFELRGQKMERV